MNSKTTLTTLSLLVSLCAAAADFPTAGGDIASNGADGWNGGSNIATLKAVAQKLEGMILVGSDSALTLELTDGSSFTGRISGEITNAKGTVVSTETGTVNVSLDDTSTWTLTADTRISGFSGNAGNVISNGYTLYVDGVALEGTN